MFVLAQYSLAPQWRRLEAALATPVLSPPQLTAGVRRSLLVGGGGSRVTREPLGAVVIALKTRTMLLREEVLPALRATSRRSRSDMSVVSMVC